MTKAERINKYGRYPLRIELKKKALEARRWIKKKTGLKMYQIDNDAYLFMHAILKDNYKEIVKESKK